MPRTSLTDPIRVDWLPGFAPGRVGMTLAPGKFARSSMGPSWSRSLTDDLDHLAGHYSARILVCLLEDHELLSLNIAALVEEAERRSIRVVRLPIRDGGVPSGIEQLLELVTTIRAEAAGGAHVVIHCRAGLGRTGVVAGGVLIAEGKSAREAIEILHRVRGPRSPETLEQETFLERFERHLRPRGGR
jgi:ADP-ribosyl-[dinitrogen reductase] hydrolase